MQNTTNMGKISRIHSKGVKITNFQLKMVERELRTPQSFRVGRDKRKEVILKWDRNVHSINE